MSVAEYKVGRLRLRSVKFKSGGEIRALPANRDAVYDPADVKRRIGHVVDALQGPVAGFAIVIWGPGGDSVARMDRSQSSRMPLMMIPDFVRNRLLAEQIERWTIDDMQRDND